MIPQQPLSQPSTRQWSHGFSLVELSIVLVILGLLTGGILAGQDLIRSAELRAVTTEYNEYQAAVQTFRNKYMAIPGDMDNAEAFWGSAGCPDTAGSGTETCNGDGDGVVDQNADDEYGEMHTFWQHLANAGLIEGSYTGMAGPGDEDHAVPGVNAPTSRFGNAGWSVDETIPSINSGSNSDVPVSHTSFFEGTYSNWPLIFGNEHPSAAGETRGEAITAEEAWNIDTKTDDGRPGTGMVRVQENAPNCHDAGTSTTVALAPVAEYDLTSTGPACQLIFNGL